MQLWKNLFLGDDIENFWISATRFLDVNITNECTKLPIPSTNDWIWFTTGERITYFNWHIGEPNNIYHHGELCVDLKKDNKIWKWVDKTCWDKINFICEYTWTKEDIQGNSKESSQYLTDIY